MKGVIAPLLLSLLCGVTLATLGVDYSTRVTVTNCLVSNGYVYAVPRGYCSYGGIDANVVANLKSAWDGGMHNVDVYMFPCVPCGNPKNQVDQLVNALSGSKYGMIWVDVEIYKWSGNQEANRNFILEAVAQIKARGKVPGIYTSYNNWQNIVGINWDGVSSLPLWYAHYDNDPSFRDYRAFGGWSKPAIKQYAGDKSVCGAGVDLNFY